MPRRLAVALVACSLFAAACSGSKSSSSSSSCKGSSIACGDVCVDPTSDNKNCGSCGNACGTGTACSNRICAVSCGIWQVNCGGTCINPNTDRSHCGATGTCTELEAGEACAEGQVCSSGACTQSCSTGWTVCPTTDPTYCADLTYDSNNCGTCGTVCPSGSACSGGTCRSSCPAGEYACGGRCIDPKSDRVYCGAAADCSGATACRANEACQNGTCTPTMARIATAIVTGDPGLTSWAQTVPEEDGAGSVFPGQANIWSLDRDFSLAGAPYGWEYSAALQLAVGDVTASPTLAALYDDWAGQVHLFPYDQRADEVTFLTPRFGIADGIVTSMIGVISGVPALDGRFSGYLNGTADSRLVRTVTLEPDQTYTLAWQDQLDLYDDSLLGAANQPYGPRYQVVLRNRTTGAVIGDPLFVTTAVSFSSASPRTASFSTAPGNVPAGPVDLSFELRSAAFGSAAVDDVDLSSDAGVEVVSSVSDNGDFESGVAPWRFGGGGESRNIRSAARAVGVDPSSATTLAVTRTFYASPTATWARFVDEFRNDGDAPVTTKVVYHTTLGGSAPSAALAAGDRAVVGWDTLGGVRDVGLVFGTGSAYFDPQDPFFGADVFFVHDVTVPPHGRVALAHFVVQLGQGATGFAHLTTGTDAVCAAIADGFPGEYAQDLEAGVLGRIVNF